MCALGVIRNLQFWWYNQCCKELGSAKVFEWWLKMQKFFITVLMHWPRNRLIGFGVWLVFCWDNCLWTLDMRFRPIIHCFLEHFNMLVGLLTGSSRKPTLLHMSWFVGTVIEVSCVSMVSRWCAMWRTRQSAKAMRVGCKEFSWESQWLTICFWCLVMAMSDWLTTCSAGANVGVPSAMAAVAGGGFILFLTSEIGVKATGTPTKGSPLTAKSSGGSSPASSSRGKASATLWLPAGSIVLPLVPSMCHGWTTNVRYKPICSLQSL